MKIKNSTLKSNVFLSLQNGRRPQHNDKRNIGQANIYLIMTVQTNYLTVIKIWCLKSEKTFIKNNCLKGTNHIALGGNRYVTDGNHIVTGGNRNVIGGNRYVIGGYHYVIGGNRYVIGGNRYVIGGNRYVIGGNHYVIGGNRYVTGGNRYVTGGNRYVTGGNHYVIGGNYYVIAGILCLSIIIIQYYQMKKIYRRKIMKFSKKKMEQALSDIRVMLDNTKKSDEIKALLIRYGIDDERINEGYEKLNTAEELFRGKTTKIGDQISVSVELEGKFAIAYKQYMGYVKLSRIVLEDDPGARKALGVDGFRGRTFAGLLAQAKQFYLGAQNNDAIFEKLKRFLVSKENLKAQLDLLLEVETINSDQENKKGQAQEATLLRNMALKELFKYRAEYKISARLALAERPQLLDSLGILARSEGYKRKRKKDNEEEPEDQTDNS